MSMTAAGLNLTRRPVHPRAAVSVRSRDFAFHVWTGCRRALETAATQQGWNLTALSESTGLHTTTIHRAMRGQDRLSVETFTQLTAALGLDPVRVLSAAMQSAAETVANPTVL